MGLNHIHFFDESQLNSLKLFIPSVFFPIFTGSENATLEDEQGYLKDNV